MKNGDCKVDTNTSDRPDSVAFVEAVEDIIDAMAVGNMTPIEVLGCLDLVAKEFYKNHFWDED